MLSRAIQEFYQQEQNLLVWVDDINVLPSLERDVNRYNDAVIKLFNKRQRSWDKEIHHLQCHIQNQEKLQTKNEEPQQRLIRAKEMKEAFAILQTELQQQSQLFRLQIEDKRQKLHKGLSPARVQQFHQFLADESLAGDRCSVCQDDIEFGRRMMRLDCHHVFCQECVEGWLTDHNTCPNCRKLFV